MATAFIIDPAVRNYPGHHFTAAAGWAGAARAQGLDVRILAHEECIVETAGTILIERIFSGSFYNVAPVDPKEAWTCLRIMQRKFRDDLFKPLMHVQPADVAILSHSTLVTLNGLAAWASGMPGARLPRLVIWLMTRPQEEDFVAPFGSMDCLVSALDRLRTLFGDRLLFAGSTREVSGQWEALDCGSVHLLPFTALRRELEARQDYTLSSLPSIVLMGHFGTRKGMNHVPALVREIDQRGVQVRWTIAVSSFETGSPAFAEVAQLAERQPNVSLITHRDGLKEYDGFLKSADLAVLAYSPDVYKERGSGVAEEAELLGLPYVAPRVAFSADAVSAGAAVAFEEWTVEKIASAVAEAVSALPQLSRHACHHAARVHERSSAIRKKILTSIFQAESDETTVPAAPVSSLPGVDIVVTLHNYRRFLLECLESVRRQSYPNWRCIVVDDGSKDLNFHELRTIVRGFGDRFSYERHGVGGGQMNAVATGLSLGANPFVVMLDADDCLTDDALDVHLSWHLNSRVPAAFTSGRAQVMDELGRDLAGCLDNVVWLDGASFSTDLPCADAYRRMGAQFEPPSASFIRQTTGQWFWSATSALMFRRSMMELLLPERIEIGKLGADTYFANASHAIGGSILVDGHVARYRRHGTNGYSDMGVYGAGTMATRSTSSNWEEVAANLRARVERNSSQFHREIHIDHINRLLFETAPRQVGSIQVASERRPSWLERLAKRVIPRLLLQPFHPERLQRRRKTIKALTKRVIPKLLRQPFRPERLHRRWKTIKALVRQR